LQPAKVVDHIVPVKEGGERFERVNLQSLCVPCHNAKTASETTSMRNQALS
jgi:5-methylcytosine-specific restriction protein A